MRIFDKGPFTIHIILIQLNYKTEMETAKKTCLLHLHVPLTSSSVKCVNCCVFLIVVCYNTSVWQNDYLLRLYTECKFNPEAVFKLREKNKNCYGKKIWMDDL